MGDERCLLDRAGFQPFVNPIEVARGRARGLRRQTEEATFERLSDGSCSVVSRRIEQCLGGRTVKWVSKTDARLRVDRDQALPFEAIEAGLVCSG
jgi:hypothetical protein